MLMPGLLALQSQRSRIHRSQVKAAALPANDETGAATGKPYVAIDSVWMLAWAIWY